MKKKNDTPRISTSIGVSLLVLVTMLTPWSQSSFASWDLSSLAKLSLIHIETVNRSNQAREILRENYHPDLIRGQEVEKVHAFIHEWVRTNLQGKWKVHTAEIASTIIQESAKRDLDPIFLVAVIDQESKFHPMALGTSGERGLMQLMPKTAKWVAQKYEIPWQGDKTRRDPVMNIRIGAAYLAHLRDRFKNQGVMYLQAYNMGVSKLNRAIKDNKSPQEYANRVSKIYREYYGKLSKQSSPSS